MEVSFAQFNQKVIDTNVTLEQSIKLNPVLQFCKQKGFWSQDNSSKICDYGVHLAVPQVLTKYLYEERRSIVKARSMFMLIFHYIFTMILPIIMNFMIISLRVFI